MAAPATIDLLRRSMELYLWDEWFRGLVPLRGETIMLVAILNFLRAWRRYNVSLRELNSLDDRELADIGITRSDIPRIAWENSER
jgi:uncharacterized protein YjiS (DUF1127 family)